MLANELGMLGVLFVLYCIWHWKIYVTGVLISP